MKHDVERNESRAGETGGGRVTRFMPAAIAVVVGALLLLWAMWPVDHGFEARVPDEGNATAAKAAASAGGPDEGMLIVGQGKASDLPGDWPQFRGPARTGWIQEDDVEVATDWGAGGPETLWQIEVGEGYAGAAVHGGRVYLMDYDREKQQDALRCLSLADGQEIWQYAYPVSVKRNHGMSRTVASVSGGYVVAIGPKCHVLCVDAVTGEKQWSIDMVNDYGGQVPDWYTGQCPLIDGDRVILAPGGPDALMIAVKLDSGEVVWKTPNAGKYNATHSSIMKMTLAGQRMYVYCASGGMVGVSVEDGRVLWQTEEWKVPIATICSPVDVGEGRIFCSDGYNVGSGMFRVVADAEGGMTVETVFKRPASVFGTTQQSPIYYGGNIYAIRANGELVCLSTAGEIQWASGAGRKFGLGPVMICNGLIFAMNDTGHLTVAKASGEGFLPVAEATMFEGHDAWGPMAVAGDRLLLRDFTHLKCVRIGRMRAEEKR